MVKIYKQPFAHDGDTIAIPDASQPDGKMSSTDGWTPDYQLPKTDPNYKPVGRQEMNGVFKEVTEALGEIQVQGVASWSADGAPYPINAQVYHDGKQWLALRANSVEPVEGADWRELLFGNLVPASESIQGLIQLATTGEAQALLNDAKALTPKKLANAFGGSNQGLTANGYQKLPGGLIIQWGQTNVSNNGTTVTFPVAFPTACLNVMMTDREAAATVQYVCAIQGTPTTVSFVGQSSFVGLNTVFWLAIGY